MADRDGHRPERGRQPWGGPAWAREGRWGDPRRAFGREGWEERGGREGWGERRDTDWGREEWEGRDREEEWGPEREVDDIYGPYGRIDRGRGGTSVRSRGGGLLGTRRSGFGAT